MLVGEEVALYKGWNRQLFWVLPDKVDEFLGGGKIMDLVASLGNTEYSLSIPSVEGVKNTVRGLFESINTVYTESDDINGDGNKESIQIDMIATEIPYGSPKFAHRITLTQGQDTYIVDELAFKGGLGNSFTGAFSYNAQTKNLLVCVPLSAHQGGTHQFFTGEKSQCVPQSIHEYDLVTILKANPKL